MSVSLDTANKILKRMETYLGRPLTDAEQADVTRRAALLNIGEDDAAWALLLASWATQVGMAGELRQANALFLADVETAHRNIVADMQTAVDAMNAAAATAAGRSVAASQAAQDSLTHQIETYRVTLADDVRAHAERLAGVAGDLHEWAMSAGKSVSDATASMSGARGDLEKMAGGVAALAVAEATGNLKARYGDLAAQAEKAAGKIKDAATAAQTTIKNAEQSATGVADAAMKRSAEQLDKQTAAAVEVVHVARWQAIAGIALTAVGAIAGALLVIFFR